MLELKKVRVEYDLGHEKLVALREVSLKIKKREIFGLVGESGCGKSTLGKMLVQLVKARSGELIYENQNLLKLSDKAFLPYRKKIQMVFQDPWSSLNPRISIGNQIKEILTLHRGIKGVELESVCASLLQEVGLGSDQVHKFPHEFSGGQLQRIGIARALAVDPKILVCDEVVSALDVSVQAQILKLLLDLRDKREMTLIFISHDLGVIRHFCDRVAVIYMGRVVELKGTVDLFANPQNPYTAKLLNSVAGFSSGVEFDESGIDLYTPVVWNENEGHWNALSEETGYLSL